MITIEHDFQDIIGKFINQGPHFELIKYFFPVVKQKIIEEYKTDYHPQRFKEYFNSNFKELIGEAIINAIDKGYLFLFNYLNSLIQREEFKKFSNSFYGDAFANALYNRDIETLEHLRPYIDMDTNEYTDSTFESIYPDVVPSLDIKTLNYYTTTYSSNVYISINNVIRAVEDGNFAAADYLYKYGYDHGTISMKYFDVNDISFPINPQTLFYLFKKGLISLQDRYKGGRSIITQEIIRKQVIESILRRQ